MLHILIVVQMGNGSGGKLEKINYQVQNALKIEGERFKNDTFDLAINR